MSDASKRDDEGVEDPDRAAIFARRQRFIAIALGMLGVAACDRRGPQPCLSVAPPDAETPTEESPTEETPTDETPPTDQTPPADETPPAIPETPGQR